MYIPTDVAMDESDVRISTLDFKPMKQQRDRQKGREGRDMTISQHGNHLKQTRFLLWEQ